MFVTGCGKYSRGYSNFSMPKIKNINIKDIQDI